LARLYRQGWVPSLVRELGLAEGVGEAAMRRIGTRACSVFVAISVALTVICSCLRLAGRRNVPAIIPFASDIDGEVRSGMEVVLRSNVSWTAVPAGNQLLPVKVMTSPPVPVVGLRARLGVSAIG